MTDDPDLRIAQSLVDYIFRRLAVDYLSYDERAELGVLTSSERTQLTLPGVEEATTPNSRFDDGPGFLDDPSGSNGAAGSTGSFPFPGASTSLGASNAPGASTSPGVGHPGSPASGQSDSPSRSGTERRLLRRLPVESDAPYCFDCGVQMQRSGSCHACPSCGSTSGCS